MQRFILPLRTTYKLVFHSSFWSNATLILTSLSSFDNTWWECGVCPSRPTVLPRSDSLNCRGIQARRGQSVTTSTLTARSSVLSWVWLEAELALWCFSGAFAPLLTRTVSKCPSVTCSRHSALLIDHRWSSYCSQDSYSEIKTFGFFSHTSRRCTLFWEAAVRPSSWIPLSVLTTHVLMCYV